MHTDNHKKGALIYLAVTTGAAVALIVLNALLQLGIPFRVEFLIGYVFALLVFVIWDAVLTKGWRRSLAMFGLSFIIAFTAEALGVNYGLVFGRYYYTHFLGVQLFGVPFLAALAWEPILYAAFTLTGLLTSGQENGHGGSWLQRLPVDLWLAAVGALATTAWDMMIDPIAVQNGWWVWLDGGAYVPYLERGVPIQNFMGWLGVSFVIILLYRWLAGPVGQPGGVQQMSVFGPLLLYASLFLTSFGVSLTILRRPEVALVGLLAMGPFIALALALFNLQRLSTVKAAPTR